jgi:hypothetical protein
VFTQIDGAIFKIGDGRFGMGTKAKHLREKLLWSPPAVDN